LIFGLDILGSPVTVLGAEPNSQVAAPPKINHILLEVLDLNASVAFYRDFVGLWLKSRSDWLRDGTKRDRSDKRESARSRDFGGGEASGVANK
jgi:hypothetical protein